MTSLRSRAALVAIAALFFASGVPAEAAPTVDELLTRYDQSMAALRRSRIEWVRRAELGYSWKPSQWSLQYYAAERDKRGRMRVVWRRRAPWPKPQDRLAPEDAYTSTFLWDGTTYYWYHVTAPSTVARWKEEGALDRLTPRRRAERAAHMVVASGALYRDEVYHVADLDPLSGVYAGDRRPVADILRGAGAKVDDRLERVGDAMCYVIEAKAPTGRYSVWIDPEHGYHVAAAECLATGDDLYYGRRLSQPRKLPAGVAVAPDLPRGRQLENRYSLHDVKFKQVGGQWVPVRAQVVTSERYEDGKQMGMIMTIERTHVDVGPDFDAARAFVPDFPDGTPVYTASEKELVANPGGDLVWRGGRVVHDDGGAREDIPNRLPRWQ